VHPPEQYGSQSVPRHRITHLYMLAARYNRNTIIVVVIIISNNNSNKEIGNSKFAPSESLHVQNNKVKQCGTPEEHIGNL